MASLLVNSAPDVEIIVADDASPKQREIHKRLSRWIETGEVKWIGHIKNLGWSENRNSLVRAASGEYVILLGDDDRLKPNAIHALREVIEKNKGIGVFGIGYDIIDETGNRVLTFCPPRPIKYGLNSGNAWKELFYYDALPMWTHHPFTLCCRRELAIRFPYNAAADIGDDVLFLFELVDAGETILATGLNLFDWRNAFAANGDYANLSSNSSRSTRARRLVWVELLKRDRCNQKIQNLITCPKFHCRFLEVGKTEAVYLKKLLETNHSSALEFVLGKSLAIRKPRQSDSISRHLRATHFLGPKYILRVFINSFYKVNNLIGKSKLKNNPTIPKGGT